jgi:hypothetical protein
MEGTMTAPTVTADEIMSSSRYQAIRRALIALTGGGGAPTLGALLTATGLTMEQAQPSLDILRALGSLSVRKERGAVVLDFR